MGRIARSAPPTVHWSISSTWTFSASSTGRPLHAAAARSIIAESAALALAGALVGFAAHAAIVVGAAWAVREQTGVVLTLARAHPSLIAVPIGVVLLGALAGLIPARAAYATDVATNLSSG